MVVCGVFDPLAFTQRRGDEDGKFVVQVQPLLRFDSTAVRRRHTDDVYDFAHSTRAVAYDPGDFWVVDHLVHRVDPSSFTARKPNDTDERYRRRVASLVFSRFTFDWRVAQAAIDAVMQPDRDEDSWVMLPPGGAAADGSVSALRCSHCLEPGASAGAPSPAMGDSPSRFLATVVAEMSVSGAARASQAPRTVPPQYQRQQQSAPAVGPRGTPSYYAAIDCAACGLPLGGTGIIVRGCVVHESLPCSVDVPRPPVVDEGALQRARAARVGATSLTAQSGGGASGVLIDGVANPLAAAMDLAAAIEERRLSAVARRAARGAGPHAAVSPADAPRGSAMAGHGAWSMDGHVHGAQPGTSSATHTPAQRRPDRPDGRARETTEFMREHVAGGEAAGSILSRTRMSEALAPARLAEIVRCIDGGCDAARCQFAPTPCTGCQRRAG